MVEGEKPRIPRVPVKWLRGLRLIAGASILSAMAWAAFEPGGIHAWLQGWTDTYPSTVPLPAREAELTGVPALPPIREPLTLVAAVLAAAGAWILAWIDPFPAMQIAFEATRGLSLRIPSLARFLARSRIAAARPASSLPGLLCKTFPAIASQAGARWTVFVGGMVGILLWQVGPIGLTIYDRGVLIAIWALPSLIALLVAGIVIDFDDVGQAARWFGRRMLRDGQVLFAFHASTVSALWVLSLVETVG